MARQQDLEEMVVGAGPRDLTLLASKADLLAVVTHTGFARWSSCQSLAVTTLRPLLLFLLRKVRVGHRNKETSRPLVLSGRAKSDWRLSNCQGRWPRKIPRELKEKTPKSKITILQYSRRQKCQDPADAKTRKTDTTAAQKAAFPALDLGTEDNNKRERSFLV